MDRPAPRPDASSAEILRSSPTASPNGLMNAQHPRQFGYFTPPPLPMSIMGELLAQVANQGVDVWHAGPFAAFVEEEVVRWLCDLVGYGEAIVRLADERRGHGQFHGHDARSRPASRPSSRSRRRHRVAGISRAHASTRAIRPTSRSRARSTSWAFRRHARRLPSDDDFPARGTSRGSRPTRSRCGPDPFAIAAVAGSTNTGSVDAVGELADVADAEGLWLHVDAAYGGGARLSERDRERVPNLDRAHSVTVDPHKWFFQAYDIGGLLVRDGRMLAAVFGGARPEYYRGGETPGDGVRDYLRVGEHDDGDGAPDQLNFYKLRSRGRAAGAPSSCG